MIVFIRNQIAVYRNGQVSIRERLSYFQPQSQQPVIGSRTQKACRSDHQRILKTVLQNFSTDIRDNLGLNLNLSRGQLYDANIQHGRSADYSDGLPALINWTNEKMGGTPASGVDEKDWMKVFLDVRRADLENAVDPATRAEKTVLSYQ